MNMSRGHNNWNLNLKFSAFTQKRIHRSILNLKRSKGSPIAVTSLRIAVVIAKVENKQIKAEKGVYYQGHYAPFTKVSLYALRNMI